MSKYSEHPVNRLNKFVTDRLRGIKQLGGSVVSGTDIIPQVAAYTTDTDTDDEFQWDFLMPAQQNAEGNTPYDDDTKIYVNLPFGVYTMQLTKLRDEPWMECGQVTYTFYSTSMDKVMEIANFLQDLLKREDWSAYDINFYFRNDSTNPFDFKNINLISGIGPIGTKDEGGRSSYMLVIGFDAVYEGTGRVGNYGDNTNTAMW